MVGGKGVARKPVTGWCCPNVECNFHGKASAGNIIRHSFNKRKDRRRRRDRCTACGKTFSANTEMRPMARVRLEAIRRRASVKGLIHKQKGALACARPLAYPAGEWILRRKTTEKG